MHGTFFFFFFLLDQANACRIGSVSVWFFLVEMQVISYV